MVNVGLLCILSFCLVSAEVGSLVIPISGYSWGPGGQVGTAKGPKDHSVNIISEKELWENKWY